MNEAFYYLTDSITVELQYTTLFTLSLKKRSPTFTFWKQVGNNFPD